MLGEGIGMKKYLHGPMHYAETLSLRLCVGDLELPERRKRHEYASSREEQEVDAQMCPCGKARESKTHIVGEREMYKGKRDVLYEDMREIDEYGMN